MVLQLKDDLSCMEGTFNYLGLEMVINGYLLLLIWQFLTRSFQHGVASVNVNHSSENNTKKF